MLALKTIIPGYCRLGPDKPPFAMPAHVTAEVAKVQDPSVRGNALPYQELAHRRVDGTQGRKVKVIRDNYRQEKAEFALLS